MEESRNIPAKVQREVKARHFLECAWDGTRLTDQHHIEEYAIGGSHTTENLILLCPNCHRQVHQGVITDAELRERQKTHRKGDRKSIAIPFNAQHDTVRVGNNLFIRNPIILEVGRTPVLSYKTAPDGEVLFSARMFNHQGDLVLWMSDNRLVMPTGFRVITEGTSIEIQDTTDPDNHLEIWQDNGVINVTGSTYYSGRQVVMSHSAVSIEGGSIFSGCTFNGNGGGIAVSGFAREWRLLPAGFDCFIDITEWPLAKSGWIKIISEPATATSQEYIINLILRFDKKLVVDIRQGENGIHFITQPVDFSLNCTYCVHIETSPMMAYVFINGDRLQFADRDDPDAPVYVAACHEPIK